jgi:hypothetical protein
MQKNEAQVQGQNDRASESLKEKNGAELKRK